MKKEEFQDNQIRLKNCIQKAEQGKELTIAFSESEVSLCKWRDRRNHLSFWCVKSCRRPADV